MTQDKIRAHRRNRSDGPRCGRIEAGEKIFGYGMPSFPYPADFGKPEDQYQYEWCQDCLNAILAEKQ